MNGGSSPEPVPLSEREQALWFLQTITPDAGVANIALALHLRRPVQLPAVREALRHVARRHPMLRSRFALGSDGRPFRLIHGPDTADVPLRTRDTTGARLDDDLRHEAGRPFALAVDEPLRAALLTADDGRQVLLVVFHHLVFDGMSTPVFLADLDDAYTALVERRPVGTDPLPLVLQPEPDPHSVRYWTDQVERIPPDSMRLLGGRYLDRGTSFDGARLRHRVPEPITDVVRGLRRELRVSDNVVLLAAFTLLLHQHGAGPEITVGVPINLRRPDQRTLVGPYFSTVPVTVRVDPDAPFATHVATTRDAFLAAFEHRAVSYEFLLERARPREYDWRSPLFRHLFNYHVLPLPNRSLLGGTVADIEEVDTGFSPTDLDLVVGRRGGRFELVVTYATGVHDRPFVERLCQLLENLLDAIVTEPDAPVGRLPLWAATDEAVAAANRTEIAWPPPTTVLGMFRAQAARRPDAPAIVATSGTHTFRQLHRLAGAMRRRLDAEGVGRSAVVGLTTGRTATTAAAVLACWSLGAAYVPIDPALPADLLDHQLTDADVRVVVAADGDATGIRAPGVQVIGAPPVGPDTDAALPDLTDPADAAYVIYTSGSTGRPKGVRVGHASLTNQIRHFAAELEFGSDGSAAWLTSVTFDPSALELFLPLATGGRAVVIDDDDRTTAPALARRLREADVRVVQATPTLWRLVVDHIGDALAGRTVLCGGEPLTPALAKALLRTECRLYNVYGPTETTIWSTMHPIRSAADCALPLIGRPIANTVITIVDGGATLPVGAIGEIAIGGAGVAMGYLNLPDLTAQRFVEHAEHGRVYRTGDRGRWTADGTLQVLGRLDRQVKVAGHRIELDEIELVLERHPAVRAAAVVVRDAGLATATTAAFVVADSAASGEQLRAFAADRLPGYAVPTTVTLLDRMPTNTSGKVDHDRLATLPVERAAARNGDESSAPVDPLTDRLTQLWRDALQTPAVDADSHFFRNGGHSVRAALLVARIGRELAVDLPLSSLFRSPTPRLLAVELARLGAPPPATTVAAPATVEGPATVAADHVGAPAENGSTAPPAGRGEADVADWLRSFWSRTLSVAQIRPDDDVFDLGANSIAATQLITDVHAAFGVRLRLSHLFDHPTIRQMSGAITGLMRHEAGPGSA